ncbi:hypothetical protein B0O80DRAFT_428577 [Mortierella sp. GBAus27b]|nr:hypothetical protein B0O80DRAFT_428577 [Mortierella sp. GBAus27b]
MTDRSDQLASPTLSRDKEEGFTNTQPHTSNGPLAVGNPYEAIDCVIKPSGTAFALTTRTAEYHNIDRETTTVLSRASSSESLGGVIDMKTRGAKDQVDVPIDQMEVIGRITPPSPIPSEDIQPENGLGQHNLTQLNWSTILTESSTMPGLPTDLSRPCPRPNNLSEIPITIDSTLTRSLRKLALEHETDLGIVVVAGWSAVLARLSGQDDTIINFVMENSAQSMDDKVLPLQIDLSGEPDTTQLLGRVQKLVSSVMAPQDMELDLSSLPQVGLRCPLGPPAATS